MSGCRIVTFAALDISMTIPNNHTLVKIHFAVWQNRVPRDVIVANTSLTMQNILNELMKIDTNDAKALENAWKEGALYMNTVNELKYRIPNDSQKLNDRFPDLIRNLQGSSPEETRLFETNGCKTVFIFVGKVLEDLPTEPPNVSAPAPIVPSPDSIVPAPIVPAPIVPSPIVPSPIVPAPIVPAPIVPAPIVPAPSPQPSKSIVAFSLDNTSLILIGGFLLVCCCVIVALLVMQAS